MKYEDVNQNLLNKWIILNDFCQNISKYTISRVLEIGEDYILTDTFKISKENYDKIDLLDDPLYNMNIEVDDEVTLTRNYTSFKTGQKVKINEFIDSEKTKFRTDGLVPGGYINTRDVTKPLDYNKFRFKTFLECCLQFGTNWIYTNCKIPNKIVDILGSKLSNHLVKNNTQSFFIGSTSIPGFYITDEPIKEKKYELRLKNEDDWKKLKKNYTSDGFIQTATSFKGSWEKPINIFLKEKYKGLSILKLLKIINTEGGIRDKNENWIDSNMLDLIEIK